MQSQGRDGRMRGVQRGRAALKGGGVHDVQGMVAPGIKELGAILAEFSQRILAGADTEMAHIMLQHH